MRLEFNALRSVPSEETRGCCRVRRTVVSSVILRTSLASVARHFTQYRVCRGVSRCRRAEEDIRAFVGDFS